MSRPAAAFLGVKKRYGRRGPWVLDGINLELQTGKGTAVVGGNGSGKSTMLRIAAGVSRPTTGSVSRPTQVGYVPERQPARVRMSGAEYLAHMGRIRGLDHSVIGARIAELFERLNLRPGPDAQIDSLSKGNRQKVFVAQALLASLPLLVLDEPFTGLDADAFLALTVLLEEARLTGTSVLISAHETQRIPAFFETLRLMNGELDSSPDEDLAREGDVYGSVRIVLLPGMSMCDPDSLAQLRGVRSASPGESKKMLNLVVEETYRERILAAAIASGWRVLRVGPSLGPSGEPEDR